MGLFIIVQARGFGTAKIPILEMEWVYPREIVTYLPIAVCMIQLFLREAILFYILKSLLCKIFDFTLKNASSIE